MLAQSIAVAGNTCVINHNCIINSISSVIHILRIFGSNHINGMSVHHQGLLTFGVMAVTIAVLTFAYCLSVVLLTHFLAERLRANPLISRVLEKLAGGFLIGFGVKLALTK